ncbi:adenylate/guanylate cyclase domain-containing protein [Horticoccus sp. 23ND18S-11]|uniref:adenylate/guanylate cyclase domain-containing protein n=1 Tax=Horticoccus sp. 23ND18S-11 TaxID=3391832 RepID=UPI0039C8F72B
MPRLSFRTKLLIAMLLVVAGGGVTTLIVTQQRVQETFERLYHQQFRRQIDYFATLQESRLEATRELCLKLSQSEGIIAALSLPEPDSAKLYALATAEFNDAGGARRPGQRSAATVSPRGDGVAFLRFVDPQGKALLPPDPPGTRRFTSGLRARLDSQAPFLASAITAVAVQQIAYMSMEAEATELGIARPGLLRPRAVGKEAVDDRPNGFQEVIVTEIMSADRTRTIGGFVLGLPMPDLVPQPLPEDKGSASTTATRANTIRAGMLYRGRLYANPAVLSNAAGVQLAEAVEAEIRRSGAPQAEFNLKVEDVPHRVFYQLMNPGSVFPPAHQVCVFSMAEAEREKVAIRLKIAASSFAVLLGAVVFSLVFSHGLAAPLRRLTEGTHAIAQGNLEIRLPVQGTDDIGQLTRAFNEMAEGLALKEKYRTVLNLVADEKIAHQLIHGQITLGGELREISVLFCDIRSFTAHTQAMPPGEVIEMLNEHMTRLTGVVKAHNGVLDKFVGDLLMAVFGAPIHHASDAENAARCALALTAARADLNETSRHQLAIGVAVATGTVVAGCMGSQDRLNYTVLGERVNLASRLCSIAGPGEVLIDEATLEKLGGRGHAEAMGEVKLKGFSEPVRAFRLHSVD